MRKKFSKKNLVIYSLIFIILASGIAYAVVESWSNGWKVYSGSGSKKVVTLYNGLRYQVTNTLGKAIFVPTRTPEEWDAFQANKPAGVTTCKTEDGGWTSWYCGSCSNSCNSLNKCSGTISGSRICTRACTDPSLTCGGAACSGSSSKTESCTVTCTASACGSGEYCNSGTCVNCPLASSYSCGQSVAVSGCPLIRGTKCTVSGETCKKCAIDNQYYCSPSGITCE